MKGSESKHDPRNFRLLIKDFHIGLTVKMNMLIQIDGRLAIDTKLNHQSQNNYLNEICETFVSNV